VGPGYQVGFAERIRRETGMMTGAVGMIATAAEASAILSQEKADVVIMARQFLRDPYFPLHVAQELGFPASWPEQYLRAAAPGTPKRQPIELAQKAPLV
jgi:2,4-dienoyl-CoA reductase-like NADH-dependent reductase (Old Yellow Enzyme family)